MTQDPLDDARLAALLDGTLDAEGRAETLRAVGQSDDAAAVLAAAAAALRELEEEGALVPVGAAPRPSVESRLEVVPGGVGSAARVPNTDALRRPAGRPAWWRAPSVRWLAAAVLLLCALPLVLTRRSVTEEGATPFAIPLSAETVRRGADAPPEAWSTTRSDGATLSPDVRAARLGARLAEVELAAARGDSAALRAAAADVAALAGQLSATLAGYYGGLDDSLHVGDTATVLRRGRQAVRAAVGSPDDERLDLAGWARLARAAAAAGDTTFLGSRAGRRLLERAAARFPAGVPEGDAVRRLRAVLAREAPPEAAAVQDAADALLAALAR